MSWFKELTSKAEAMLVKLDQDAAQALHNPDGLLSKPNLFDHSNNHVDKSETVHPSTELIGASSSQSPDQSNSVSTIGASTYTPSSAQSARQEGYSIKLPYEDVQKRDTSSISKIDKGQSIITDKNTSQSLQNNVAPDSEIQAETSYNYTSNNGLTKEKTTRYSKKFTIQTSSNSSLAFISNNHSYLRKPIITNDNLVNTSKSSNIELSDESLGADNIRASINKSLQEYSNEQSSFFLNTSKINDQPPAHDNQTQGAYRTHFDQQPNLITSLPLLGSNLHDKNIPSRSNSSASICVEVPDEQSMDSRESSITARLLRNSVSKKKKSTFYLHQVINRLANPDDRQASYSILSDQSRIKFRRMQLRAGSYFRRLNYYFQAYPMMKYVVIGYLALMQLLVIYVLFFYQSSSSSSNDLSTQIKQQQRELAEPN